MFSVTVLYLGLSAVSELTIIKKYRSVIGEMAQLKMFYEIKLAAKTKPKEFILHD